MRCGKTGYAVEESVRASVSVDALQKLEYFYTNTDEKTGYAVEDIFMRRFFLHVSIKFVLGTNPNPNHKLLMYSNYTE